MCQPAPDGLHGDARGWTIQWSRGVQPQLLLSITALSARVGETTTDMLNIKQMHAWRSTGLKSGAMTGERCNESFYN